ncbi:MAG TPA: HTTM domain-containing protein, partial [Candidatus Limnocylindria bacterium]|nr:HTTM domain-containing protein [Candidatus Limnocylindria bacterium]
RRQLLAFYPERLSLLNVVGEWWQVAVVWAFACVVALAVAVGWRTRLACFLAFVLIVAFQWRNPLILDGSDLVFRFVPLWLMFTNAGGLWSIDALRGPQPPSGRGWALPVRILELQVAWIYLATGIEKLAGALWVDGTAAYYALQLEHTFGRWWARPIALQPFLVKIISWGTIAVELGFLPLAMIPSRITRVVAAVAAGGLHFGILTLMNVGNFPVIMLSTLVLFLPATWVRAFVERMHGAIGGGVPHGVRRSWERFVAFAAERLPAPTDRPVRRNELLRRFAELALVVFALFVFSTAVPRQLDMLRPTGDAGGFVRFLSLDQRWDMFSPDPARADGWMLGPARLTDGTTFDLYTGGPVDNTSERYSDPLYTRWVKVHERIANAGYGDYRLEYARHFCRARNLHLQPGQVPLDSFEMIYIERVVRPPGEGPPVFNEYHLWEHKC